MCQQECYQIRFLEYGNAISSYCTYITKRADANCLKKICCSFLCQVFAGNILYSLPFLVLLYIIVPYLLIRYLPRQNLRRVCENLKLCRKMREMTCRFYIGIAQ